MYLSFVSLLTSAVEADRRRATAHFLPDAWDPDERNRPPDLPPAPPSLAARLRAHARPLVTRRTAGAAPDARL